MSRLKTSVPSGLCLIALLALLFGCQREPVSVQVHPATISDPDGAKVIFLAGPDSHLPGAHEHTAGIELLSNTLRQRQPTFETVNVYGGWPADEAVLLPALKMVRTEVATLRTIIAPHEPTESRVASLLSELRRDGWRAETLGRVEADGSAEGIDAVVVDRVGVLGHLYAVGAVSYVGGGFRGDGLHSVLEPAAAATPIVFGPQHHNARAAADLVTVGGAKIARDANALAREVQNWLTDEAECDRTGRLSRRYIDVHLGAAGRIAELLDGLIAPLSDFDSNA